MTLAEIYSFMEDLMPVKRVMISLAVGTVALLIVLFSGLSSGFVREETIVSRTFSAFCFTGLASFILMMSGEEYAIYKSKRELENFIDGAPIEITDEDFDIDEYFPKEEEPAAQEVIEEEPAEEEPVAEKSDEPTEEDAFRPLDFRRE